MGEGLCKASWIVLHPGIPDIPLITRIAVTIMTSISVRPLSRSPADNPRQKATARVVVSPWTWMAVTCLILGISGGLRFWRERQFTALAVTAKPARSP